MLVYWPISRLLDTSDSPQPGQWLRCFGVIRMTPGGVWFCCVITLQEESHRCEIECPKVSVCNCGVWGDNVKLRLRQFVFVLSEHPGLMNHTFDEEMRNTNIWIGDCWKKSDPQLSGWIVYQHFGTRPRDANPKDDNPFGYLCIAPPNTNRTYAIVCPVQIVQTQFKPCSTPHTFAHIDKRQSHRWSQRYNTRKTKHLSAICHTCTVVGRGGGFAVVRLSTPIVWQRRQRSLAGQLQVTRRVW